MNLFFEAEFLAGVSYAAVGPGSSTPDWPPQPDRIFSALVATWAARGQHAGEAKALLWLEEQQPPDVIASAGEARTSATVFVPPNDARSDRSKSAADVLPAMRSRQPRRFPAFRPHDPLVRVAWHDAAPDHSVLGALQALAQDTAYIGHSSSLTRCRFWMSDEVPHARQGADRQRRVYRGRFAELQREFARGRRPLPGPSVIVARDDPDQVTNVFSDRWLLLEYCDGTMPDVRACAIVAKTLRDALMSGYRRAGMAASIPETISGHAADGQPTRAPHVAIVPLPHVGFPYADGHVMGFGIVPPRGDGLLDDPGFLKALRSVAPLDGEVRVLSLKPKEGTSWDAGFSVSLSLTREAPPNKRSMDPSLYTTPSQAFATVTPIALDRHLKSRGSARDEEIVQQIARACRNACLPEPIDVAIDKHSAFEGAPSAYPSGKSPAWMQWRLPGSLASRQLTHAVLRFGEPIRGPVILGAGRFFGLGLCRPVEEN